MSYHYYRQNIITDLPKILKDYNEQQQWRQVKNRDKIVLVPHCWSGGPIMYLEPEGKMVNTRFVCEVDKPVKLLVFNSHVLTIDPVQQTAAFTDARLWPCVLWRLNQWLPVTVAYEKYNRHTPGQIVVRGKNMSSIACDQVTILADGTLEQRTVEHPIIVTPDKNWTPYIRRTLKTLRKLVEPYEPWRDTCDSNHSTFGWQAMRSKTERPAYERVEEVLQWIEAGDDYEHSFEAYADFISLGGWWTSSRMYERSERALKRALLTRMCSKPVV